MKALKEKRISLRSLWRRGLVILSLFALVFASCSDSDSESTETVTVGGPTVYRVEIIKGPDNDQFYGKPVDLTGVELRLFYSNGQEGKETDITKMIAVPRIYTGTYASGDASFTGMKTCDIYYGGSLAKDTLTFANYPIKIWHVTRNNTLDNKGDDPLTGDKGSIGVGPQLTGALRNKKVYVDDDTFDFSGLTLQADYETLNPDTGEYLRKPGTPLKFSDITWDIFPDYHNKDNGDGSCGGYVYITVGEDTTKPRAFGNGITLIRDLDVVYTVKGPDTIQVTGADLGPYFYWEENTADAWKAKLLETGASLVVQYTGGAADKTFKIKDLAEKQRIWYNANFTHGTGYMKIKWDVDPTDIDYDFAIKPLKYPFTAKANPEPGVTVYYRGATTKVGVDVYTTLLSVSVAPGDYTYDPDAGQDNDIEYPNGDLAKLFTVNASYSAYNNTSLQEDYLLVYDVAAYRLANPKAGYVPYYTITNYDTAHDKWEANKLKGKDTVQAMTISHTSDPAEVRSYWTTIIDDPTMPTNFLNEIKRVTKTTKPTVTWIVR